MDKIKKNIGKIFMLYSAVVFVVLYSILLLDIIYVIIAMIPVAIVFMFICKENVIARVGFWLLVIFRTKKLSNKLFTLADKYGTTYNNALAPYGFNLLKQFKYEEAKVIYEKMLTKQMTYAMKKLIMGNLSVALWKLKQYDESIRIYEEIVLDPAYIKQIGAGDYATLGFICIEAGQFDKGEKYTRDAIELKPEYHAALDNFGQMYFIKGDFEKAEDYFLQALIQKPTLVESNYYLGCIFEARGEKEHAMEYFEYASQANISAFNTITKEMILKKLN
ncbi:MAG: Tetratricopeptide 1 repeat-containing protein [Clostridiales bacterium]|nr:Tetratricopeptide 1 repeat-containing protein [Clostridiales bacterium]